MVVPWKVATRLLHKQHYYYVIIYYCNILILLLLLFTITAIFITAAVHTHTIACQ
jgi:hypothetical protein